MHSQQPKSSSAVSSYNHIKEAAATKITSLGKSVWGGFFGAGGTQGGGNAKSDSSGNGVGTVAPESD